ncbi:MAG: inositol monophosphatase family protein [Pseudobdellovibrionaceae bacterium]|nr:inositol monophosphatase family protein [Pseudobdellovibrionaceae bacterium]
MTHLNEKLLSMIGEFRQIANDELKPRFGQLQDAQIHQHSDGSLYTEADLQSERRLIAAAHKIYPEAISTGEEQISEDPVGFLNYAQEQIVWIFDPIDGTGAFKNGDSRYGMMGALVDHGKTIAGIIYTPEKDLMIVSEKDKGCWLYQNGTITEPAQLTLTLRPTSLTDKARIAFACRNQDARYEEVLAKGVVGYRPRNNSSYDYTSLLLGQIDTNFYSEGYTNQGLGKCPPWDHAAGVLCVTEAGGYAALPYAEDGVAYNPLACHDRLLVSTNRELFSAVYKHISTRALELLSPR